MQKRKEIKKTTKEFEKYILNIIDKYSPILLLDRHTFEVRGGAQKGLMECLFSYPYLNIIIQYSTDAFEDWKKGKDMVRYIVHEMCHPITDPIYSKALSRFLTREEIEDERENLTDLISHIVLKNIKI